MLARSLVVESSIINVRIPSHIRTIFTYSTQNRRFVKFPRIFNKKKPDIVAPSRVNLHDQNTGFTNFIKTLDSLVLTEEATVESFVSLFERFEVSLSDDNEHLLKVLDSYDTGTLVLILDSLTYYNQSKTSKNINILLDNLCRIMSRRDLLSLENEDNGTTLTMLLLNILNRIKHKSNDHKNLLVSLNKQVKANVDLLIENGSFTHFLNLFCYSLDPSYIYTVVYCCLFKLDKFKNTDYTNLPRFLFNFKIYDPHVLTNVISHAASLPSLVFESDGSSFGNFLKDLRLFDQLYNTKEIPFNATVLYFEMLNKNVASFNEEGLFFILSNIPPLKLFDKLVTTEYKELMNKILFKIGVVSQDNRFKGTSHLEISKFISFVNYINKVELEYQNSGVEWNQLKPVLLNETNIQSLFESDSIDKDDEVSFFNDVAKDISARILKEIPQNSKLKDIDYIFKKTNTLERLFLMLDRCNRLNVDEIYTDSLTLSLKRLLSLLADSGSLEGDLFEFLNNMNGLNIRTIRQFSFEMYNLVNKNDLELYEKALRFKLLYLRKNNNQTISTSTHGQELLNDFNLFEVLKDNLDYRNCTILVNLLDLIHKSSKIVDDSLKTEFDKSFEKFGDIVYQGLKNELRLLDYNLMELLLNLAPECNLLSQLDSFVDQKIFERDQEIKIPQMLTLFIYKFRRVKTMNENNKFNGVEGIKKIQDILVSKLEEFVNILESSFTQRVWIEQPSENTIKKINPWVNEHGLKHIFKKPEEPFDMFLYEKSPKLDKFFDLYKYIENEQENSEGTTYISSLYELRVELVELNRQLTKEEMINKLEKSDESQKGLEKLISNVGSHMRKALLVVEMCRPISRDYYLPKKHIKELVKLSLKKFYNKNNSI